MDANITIIILIAIILGIFATLNIVNIPYFKPRIKEEEGCLLGLPKEDEQLYSGIRLIQVDNNDPSCEKSNFLSKEDFQVYGQSDEEELTPTSPETPLPIAINKYSEPPNMNSSFKSFRTSKSYDLPDHTDDN